MIVLADPAPRRQAPPQSNEQLPRFAPDVVLVHGTDCARGAASRLAHHKHMYWVTLVGVPMVLLANK